MESQEQEEDEYPSQPEADEHSHNTHNNQSRYIFAAVSFLIALLFLSGYLNHEYELTSWLYLLGVFAFGIAGLLFLLPKSIFNRVERGIDDDLYDIASNDFQPQDEALDEYAEGREEGDLSSFEHLVDEALATIPEEFHQRMENVLVRVQYEPGVEVLERVGIKRGYTLLGLYEGVPLTAFGHGRVPHPEIITIYQRNIEAYCQGDPDRIREQVRHTVLHEVAHHFGIDHEEMPIWIR